MKSPQQLTTKLARQWAHADTREKRLLSTEAWPIELTIGKPGSQAIKHHLNNVRTHLNQWRNINIGEVVWEHVQFRDTQDAIEIPKVWRLHKPSDWIAATQDRVIKKEFESLAHVVSQTDPLFHSLLIRQRHLSASKSDAEIILACKLALELTPQCARNQPLRALSIAGIDSKFFERNRRLIIKLLDIRFDGLISDIGLEAFLGASKEEGHWLLIVDLDGTLLPFEQMRIRDSELATTSLPGSHTLIIENERCLHQLPRIKNTTAILGAGLNLNWMQASWLDNKSIAYWGDVDTWGLSMLATARQHQPSLTALLMTDTVFKTYQTEKAVAEPVTAGDAPPKTLTASETALYQKLITSEQGRLEQEFIPTAQVHNAIREWITGSHKNK